MTTEEVTLEVELMNGLSQDEIQNIVNEINAYGNVFSVRLATPKTAIQDILGERKRQDEKWGEQNHSPIEWIAILGEEYGEACQGALRSHFGGKTLQEYRKEMVEVAAVAVAAIECLDRHSESEIKATE